MENLLKPLNWITANITEAFGRRYKMWIYNPETNDKDLWVDLVDENGEPLVDEDGDIIDDPDGYFSNY